MDAASDAAGDLFRAIQAGDVDGVTRLLESVPALLAARSASGLSPLVTAAYYGQHELVLALLAAGAEVDVFAAAVLGDRARIGGLLDREAELIHAISADGWTPLHLAAYFGQRDLAADLLARGADVGARSRNLMENTPLHAALAGRRAPVAELLLAHDADPNARQRGGWAPLHQAADHGDAALVLLLLAHGAESDARQDDGKTALSIALDKGHQEIAGLLQRPFAAA